MKTFLIFVLLATPNLARADTFRPTGELSVTRTSHTATLLDDGRVLVTGGTSDKAAELYDPATGTFRRVGEMSRSRWYHTATLLNDGRVLIAGGSSVGNAGQIDDTAEVFDPATESFSAPITMVKPRHSHAAVLLPDGRVLLTGGAEIYSSGLGVSTRPQADDEIFNPLTNTFSSAASMRMPRWNHTATALTDGTVLIAGCPQNATSGDSCAEIFAGAGTPVRNVSPATKRSLHSATLLNDGRVLIAGGNSGFETPRADAEVYQPSTGLFQTVTSPGTSSYHVATLLKDGRVLLTGWYEALQLTTSVAIFDPTTNSIASGTAMNTPRRNHTATALKNGKVLVVGGATRSAEIYEISATPAGPRRRASAH